MPTGKSNTPELTKHRKSISHIGIKNHMWKGEQATPSAKHAWLHRNFGSATHCENNINHKANWYHWANLNGHEYTRNRLHWRMLCPSCHKRLDMSEYCKNGHRRTIENTYNRPDGCRSCKICIKETYIKYYYGRKK